MPVYDCPACGREASITYSVYWGYQGDYPQGAMMRFGEMTDQQCECDLSDDQAQSLYERACADYANGGN